MCFDDSKDHYDCQSGTCWTSKTIEDSINCKERKRVSNGMTPAFCSCFGHNYTNFGRNYPCLLQRTPHEHHVQYWMHFVGRDTFCIHKHLSCIHIHLHNILHISRICDCKYISNLLTYCPISWSAWRMIFHEQVTKNIKNNIPWLSLYCLMAWISIYLQITHSTGHWPSLHGAVMARWACNRWDPTTCWHGPFSMASGKVLKGLYENYEGKEIRFRWNRHVFGGCLLSSPQLKLVLPHEVWPLTIQSVFIFLYIQPHLGNN